MALGMISGIIIALIATVLYTVSSYNFKRSNKGIAIATLISGIIAAIVFSIVPFSFHTVDTGTVAVVKELGKAKEVKTAGTYWDLWLTNKYQKYDGKVQNIDIATAAYSSDAQTMDITMTLQYSILTDKAMDIANQYGSLQALTTRINAVAMEKTKAILSERKAMDIIANRQELSPIVEETIRKAIGEEYFVNVVAVVLTNIDFSDAFEKAVEDKMIAEQTKLKAEYENSTAIAKAEAEAKAKIVQAEADAKVKVVAAESEAAANKLLQKTLTEEVLQEMYLNKWNGQLPTVVSGEDVSMILPSTSN